LFHFRLPCLLCAYISWSLTFLCAIHTRDCQRLFHLKSEASSTTLFSMSPSAIFPDTSAVSVHPPAEPQSCGDSDLTLSAIEHRLAEQVPVSNGHSKESNGPSSHVAEIAELDASKLTYTYTKERRHVPDFDAATSGTETVCTDHMITAKWTINSGWSTPELKPYGPLSLMPTASVLHYATECFEGLKVYRGYDGKLRLFRPDCNAARMLLSALRISLPGFPPRELEALMLALVAVDGPKWLPKERAGGFLYLRPAIIGTAPQLGVAAPKEALLFIIASFMPKMDEPAGGMRLHTSPEDMIRAVSLHGYPGVI
jgi:branched-chain amino acid aminotransferase